MITKDQLLKVTTQEQIIKFYVPEFDPALKRNYRSPFGGHDDNPSLSFYQERGSWRFKSHNTGHQGDVFQFVADIEQLDCKSAFFEVLNRINKNLCLGLKDHQELRIEYKQYSDLFKAYWRQFGVDEATLIKYKVRQVAILEFTNSSGKRNHFDYVQLNQIVTCYNIGGRIKIYIPDIPAAFNNDLNFRGQKKSFGFKSQNSSDIFGLEFLPAPPLEYIIFAAGEKDCLSANAHGFNAISLQSENQLPQEDLIKKLKTKATYLLSCYDNDDAGKRASEKLQKTFGINPIILPDDSKDLAIFFSKYKTLDFKKLVDEAIKRVKQTHESRREKSQGKTVFHQAEDYLTAKYNFRFNTIKHVFEFSLLDQFEFREVNENSLFIELNKAGIKISLNNLKALLKSDFCPRYNPLQYYFENLKEWNENEPDYISKLASYVKTDDSPAFADHFKKWLVRTVKCALIDGYYNKQALILVDTAQNAGKTSFLRFLCPPALNDYIAENINPETKDSLIALATNFIINLDELKQLSKSDINMLKSWISQDKVNVRLPYESRAQVVQRRCSFVGSTNMNEFLSDETGSVRWLCFRITGGIDHSYHNYITGEAEVNIDDVWSQAYSLYKSGFKCELDAEDIKSNEERNSQFKILAPEFEILQNFVEPSSEEKGDFVTSTELHGIIQPYTVTKLTPVMIGRALTHFKFPRVKHPQKQVYGYYIKRLKY